MVSVIFAGIVAVATWSSSLWIKQQSPVPSLLQCKGLKCVSLTARLLAR